jgi:hypothetical protein
MIYGDYTEARAEYSVYKRGYDIFLIKKVNGQMYLAQPLVYEQSQMGVIPQPTAFVEEDMAQALFDDLWRAGLRPTTKDDTPAKDEHIADLRKIAFHALVMNEGNTTSGAVPAGITRRG